MAGENSFVRYIAKNNYRLILICVKKIILLSLPVKGGDRRSEGLIL